MPPTPAAQQAPYPSAASPTDTRRTAPHPEASGAPSSTGPPYQIDPILPIPQAAQIAGLSQWTLKRRARDGELTILKISTRRIGVRMSELYRWMDTREARA
jgi:hypothetical protein